MNANVTYSGGTTGTGSTLSLAQNAFPGPSATTGPSGSGGSPIVTSPYPPSTPYAPPSVPGALLAGSGLAGLVLMLLLSVLSIVAWVRILAKAGYSGWWVLIGFVPLVNLVRLFLFALAGWPVAGVCGRRVAPAVEPVRVGPAQLGAVNPGAAEPGNDGGTLPGATHERATWPTPRGVEAWHSIKLRGAGLRGARHHPGGAARAGPLEAQPGGRERCRRDPMEERPLPARLLWVLVSLPPFPQPEVISCGANTFRGSCCRSWPSCS